MQNIEMATARLTMQCDLSQDPRQRGVYADVSSLQEYFALDIGPIQAQCRSTGIRHERLRINDFDPVHLRARLPDVVSDMYAAHAAAGGTAYVHCTAGAPLLSLV